MRARTAFAILYSLLLLAAGALSLFLITAVPFLFDAPGSEDSRGTWIMAGAILSLPLSILAALACVWIAVPARRSLWWYAGLALPALHVIAFFIGGWMREGFF